MNKPLKMYLPRSKQNITCSVGSSRKHIVNNILIKKGKVRHGPDRVYIRTEQVILGKISDLGKKGLGCLR